MYVFVLITFGMGSESSGTIFHCLSNWPHSSIVWKHESAFCFASYMVVPCTVINNTCLTFHSTHPSLIVFFSSLFVPLFPFCAAHDNAKGNAEADDNNDICSS